MRRRKRFGRWSLPLLLAGLVTVCSYAAEAQETIAARGKIASTNAVSSVPSNIRLDRMLLLLNPSAVQQKDLDSLLAAQQTPGSANYHKWLPPAQFASRFAVSASDAAAVAAWLRSQGFTVAGLPAGRGWIEFSGTIGQVQQAFRAQVETVPGSGETRHRLAGPIQLPMAISSSVKGLVSLDGVLSTPAATAPVELTGNAEALAAETSLSHTQALTPSLALSWLHLASADAVDGTGTGESIAIPARSNVRVEDFEAFRKSFGLPESELQVNLSATAHGLDSVRNTDEAAATIAASWAGVAAPEAQIVLVPATSTNATDGIDLALAAAIDGAIAHTLSLGYSACESSLSATHQAFYAELYRQAAAEGIAVIAASGDSGAVACHAPLDTNPVSSGWGVNGLASTPWNTAVSAAAFTAGGNSLTGWQPSSISDRAYATGGGASILYATPTWQSATGIPAIDPTSGTGVAHHRYLPDLSLPTAVSAGAIRGLAFCFAGDSGASGCHLVSAGGSAASAAVFSGISALLAQKYGPQGNLAPNLYALSRRSTTGNAAQSFVDIASGGAKLPCAADSQGCSESGEIGFNAAPGYDLATGLGSVNAHALIENWATPQAIGTAPVMVEMTNAPGVTYNPSAIITLTAKVLSGSGGTAPTGTVQFYDETVGADTGSAVTLTSAGTASYSEDAQFTVGGHNIQAIYSGDGTYKSAKSQPVTINIQPSPTTLTVTPSTTAPTSGSTITVTGTVTSNNLGDSPPTGALTMNLDGIAQGTTTLSTTSGVTSGKVSVTVPSAGSHTVQGYYSGDSNYNNSTSQSVTITVAKGATVTSIAATPSTLTAGVPETFTVTVAPATTATSYTITGTISFYDGGTTLLGTATIASNAATLTVTLSTTVVHTITAVYSGDTSWGASTSSALILEPILQPVTVTLTASNAVLAPDQSTTLTATVTPVSLPLSTAEQHPTGKVFFYAGTTLIGQAALANGTADTAVASLTTSSLSAGSYLLTAVYAGDTTYGTATSNSISLQVENFTITCTAADGTTNVNVKQGASKNAICVVVSSGGLAGLIQVACAEQNPPQVGAISCTFPPPGTVDGSGSITLTVATTAGNISQNSPPVGGGLLVALAGLLLSPIGLHARWPRQRGGRMLTLALLLAGMAAAGLGCNGSSTTASSGTSLGVHTLKITAAADVNTVTVSHYAYLTVNVTP